MFRFYSPAITAAAAQQLARFRTPLTRRARAQRLLNYAVPPQLLTEIERTRQVPLTSPGPRRGIGIVLERNVFEGMRAMPGDVLFRIADHSVVWAMVDVAERDLAAVPRRPAGHGSRAQLSGADLPGQGRAGLSASQPGDPHGARADRACQPAPAAQPDMYAEAEIDTGSGNAVLAVPDSAVIDSGERQIVLVDKGEGRFEPRAVQLGRRGAGYVEIRDGLKEGEKVVTSANFLIDAESNLKAALKCLTDAGAAQ